MRNPVQALETTGTIDERGQLRLDEPANTLPAGRVRVILLHSGTEVEETEWLRAAATNSAFDFLKDPAEDVYSAADGEPFRDDG